MTKALQPLALIVLFCLPQTPGELMANAAVQSAPAIARCHEPETLDPQVHLIEIPAPGRPTPRRTNTAGQSDCTNGIGGVEGAHQLYELLRQGSLDSNVPMNLSIPAISISGGGGGAGADSLNETLDSKDSWKGAQRAILLAVALSR